MSETTETNPLASGVATWRELEACADDYDIRAQACDRIPINVIGHGDQWRVRAQRLRNLAAELKAPPCAVITTASTTPAVPERGEEETDIAEYWAKLVACVRRMPSVDDGNEILGAVHVLRHLEFVRGRQFEMSARPEGEDARRLDRFGADRLAGAVCAMIDRGVLDARSEPGDALLDYASARYGDTSPISRVRARYDEIRRGQASTPTRSERDG